MISCFHKIIEATIISQPIFVLNNPLNTLDFQPLKRRILVFYLPKGIKDIRQFVVY